MFDGVCVCVYDAPLQHDEGSESSFDRGSSLNAKGPLLQTVWKQAKEWATAAGNEELAAHYRFMYSAREDEIARIRAQLDAEEEERVKQGELPTLVTVVAQAAIEARVAADSEKKLVGSALPETETAVSENTTTTTM